MLLTKMPLVKTQMNGSNLTYDSKRIIHNNNNGGLHVHGCDAAVAEPPSSH